MGSSSSKHKETNEKENKENNKNENSEKTIKVNEGEKANDNNIQSKMKLSTINAPNNNDINNIQGQSLKNEYSGKSKLPPIGKKKLNKNITNLDSNDIDYDNEILESNKRLEGDDGNNNNLKEEINNENDQINKINSDTEEKKEIIQEEEKEENKEIKEGEKEIEIDNNIDKELFKPIAELELNRKSVMKKSKYKGVTFVQNLKEFLPEDISREEVRTMVLNALSEYIVQNPKDYIKGKNLTKVQSEAIADIVYNRIVKNEDDDDNNEDIEKIEKYKILDDVKVKIGMSDLNDKIVKKLFFKNREEVSNEEITRTKNNISQGSENVKVLLIEML